MTEFSKDFRAEFETAKTAGNIEEMARIFNELCDEAGVQNETNKKSQEAGSRTAKSRNEADEATRSLDKILDTPLHVNRDGSGGL